MLSIHICILLSDSQNFNYQTSKLIDIQRSDWISNDSVSQKKILELQYPDRSTLSKEKSIPIRGKNHYINFQPTDITQRRNCPEHSAIQRFATPIVSQTPLSRMTLYLKTPHGYGGFFFASKLILF